MNGISGTMVERVTRYVQWKQGLGYSLKVTARELLRFARFADETGHQGPLTTAIILRWAQEAAKDSRLYRARRVEVTRSLARFEAAFEPRTQIPHRNIIGPAHRRIQPYIYNEQEILNLMDTAWLLTPSDGLRPNTYRMLIGLLASTGLRVCEALNLRRTDFEDDAGRLVIRETKFGKSRIVPLAESVIRALSDYVCFRDTYTVRIQTDCFFVSEQGRRLKPSVVDYTFRKIRSDVVLHKTPSKRAPRLYDLRHTFACRVIQRWYKEGVDVNQRLPYLSTYLGHIKPTDTYWYLSAVPELMQVVQSRFKDTDISQEGAI